MAQLDGYAYRVALLRLGRAPMKYLLLAALLLLTATFFAPQTGSDARPAVSRETPKPVTRPAKTLSPAKPYTASELIVKQQVANQFPDVPEMVPVLACESHFEQFCTPDSYGRGLCSIKSQGDPLLSATDDVGVAQINIPSWGKLAASLGLNIASSTADNLAMARIVYQKQGIGAWTCSKKV